MSRLSVPNLETDAGPSGKVYAQIKKAIGSVPNTFAAIAAHGPAALKSILAADTVLASGGLTNSDKEIVKLVISEAAGCDYCVAAHSHLGRLAGLTPEVLRQIREGLPTGDARRDVLVAFVDKLARTSGTISEEDFNAIKSAGYSDAQLVEISLAFATTTFTNIFNRINDTELDFPAVA
ncbi:carboxymuconolactone decarboxylase family protein [Bradyrhizobium viridifuturi]|uniref:carboxymuconolactone decarboxylase family protein n=1 Tax=Bradyrhizobium viridifuturi TaxID=1654716 RepID=UPI00067EC73B|nr:carboxymuconolactone decarboxylase family protein [Bradyrhizobium viridifuturi]